MDKELIDKLIQIKKETQQIDKYINMLSKTYKEILQDENNKHIENITQYIDELLSVQLQHESLGSLHKISSLDWEEIILGNQVLLLNIVKFKEINHTLTYEYVDSILDKMLSYIHTFSQVKVIYRYNADTFIIILDVQGREASIDISKQILEYFNSIWSFEEESYQCNVRMSILDEIKDGTSIDMFLKKIDYAYTYVKKNNADECMIFDGEIYNQFIRKDKMYEVVKRAVKNKTFDVYYQPIYNTKDKRPIKLEALARLKDVELGIISPLEFIPVLEKKGLISQMGNIIIEKVCQQIKRLEANAIVFDRISINVSVIQFKEKDFVERVLGILAKYDVSPKKIEFEITESVMIHSAGFVIQQMKKLEDKGIIFSLDDFGTGYSSLGYLTSLPIDTIKVDKVFIDHIAQQHSSRVVLKSIINMGQELGVRVIAEGVETDEQYMILNNLECNAIQGYLMSKPLPEEEVIQLLKL